MERIIKIEGEGGAHIFLHAIEDDLGRRVHLGGSMRIGRVVYLEPKLEAPPAQLGGLSKSLPDRHVLTMAPTGREVRTFFPDCAGHWTAFRDQLKLGKADLPVYLLIHETVMAAIREPGGFAVLGKVLDLQLGEGGYTVAELETN